MQSRTLIIFVGVVALAAVAIVAGSRQPSTTQGVGGAPLSTASDSPASYLEAPKIQGVLLDLQGAPYVGAITVLLRPAKSGASDRFDLFGKAVSDSQGAFSLELPSPFVLERGVSGRTTVWILPEGTSSEGGVYLSASAGRAVNTSITFVDGLSGALAAVNIGTVQMSTPPSIGSIEFNSSQANTLVKFLLAERQLDPEVPAAWLRDGSAHELVSGSVQTLYSWDQMYVWQVHWRVDGALGGSRGSGLFQRAAANHFDIVDRGELVIDLPVGWASTAGGSYYVGVFEATVPTYAYSGASAFPLVGAHIQRYAEFSFQRSGEGDLTMSLPPGTYRIEVWAPNVSTTEPALQATVSVAAGAQTAATL